MFVNVNTLSEIRGYFKKALGDKFTDHELKIMVKFLYRKRFTASDTEFLLNQDMRMSESDLLYFHKALKRIQNDEPLQYVLGETEFFGLDLKIDHRALIPRPETEELVEWILESEHGKDQIADLCAGSGCIALALKSILKKSTIFALEFSDDAVSLLKENIERSKLDLQVVKSDVLNDSYASLIDSKLDVIVSNPPYIPNKDKAFMSANVLNFEPEMALFVEDDDPLIFYREIMQRSKTVLKNKGWLYFEIHEDLGQEVVELFRVNDFVNIELRKDLQSKDRMVRGQVVTFHS